MVTVPAHSALEQVGFGKRLDDARLMLSPVELLYLMDTGCVTLTKDTRLVSPPDYFADASSADGELAEKSKVYTELRRHGLTPRTGYKFGHHFRVYCGKNVHSDLLVHAIEKEAVLPMSVISRSVRMAHSVKKKMLFGCVHTTGIQFVEFARIKL